MAIKVYIFEDHWMCREALVSVLDQHEGIEVVGSAETVSKGIGEIEHLQPDVVLMDIRFGNQDLGISATATIKKLKPGIKVIIFTELKEEKTLRDAIKAGASSFLSKNEADDPDVLIKAIQATCRGNGYLTPAMTGKVLSEMRRMMEKRELGLTKRELEILGRIAEGNDNRDIAAKLQIDIRTVAHHVSNILMKLDARNRTEAAAIARRNGIL